MQYHIGKSVNTQVQTCVDEVTKEFVKPKLILFFSEGKNFKEYVRLIHEKYPESICMGATSIVNIDKTGADKNSLMAVGIESGISCQAEVLEDPDKYPIKYVDRVQKCVSKVPKHDNTICLEFTTAFKCAEESVLATLNSVLLDKKIPVFGGTAGDDISSQITMVALNGKIYENGCVFALVHNEGGAIHLYRENIYRPINGHEVTATKVDHVKRVVKEFNHEPAAKVYARELGVSEDELGTYLDTHPMGRVFGDDMFITANNTVNPNKDIVYHARVYKNSKMVALEPDNYRKVTKETMDKIKREVPRPSFAIMCHCLARTLLFEQEGYLSDYAKEMGNVVGDYVGFSGYGEQMNRQQFNQTMIMAIFE